MSEHKSKIIKDEIIKKIDYINKYEYKFKSKLQREIDCDKEKKSLNTNGRSTKNFYVK